MALFTTGRALACGAALVALTATAATVAEADSRGGGLGFKTSADVAPAVAVGTVSASETVKDAQYGTGGVGLRNRRGGGIGISGVVTPVKAAYLYWAVITEGAPGKADSSVLLERLLPTSSSGVTVTGTAIGTGAQPCWTGDRITVFRGTVPTSVANGNGEYLIELQSGAAGTTDGADPWLSYPLPLVDGASLVIVGTGKSTVAIFDKGLAGETFAGNTGITYSLKLPISAPGKATLFDNIGADGQLGVSRTPYAGLSEERTTINGTAVAGPGSAAYDGDWNGSSGLPLPQLWDDTGHDITSVVKAGTTTLSFTINNGGQSAYDCLTPVANVVSLQ
jgi:hypothetical protein